MSAEFRRVVQSKLNRAASKSGLFDGDRAVRSQLDDRPTTSIGSSKLARPREGEVVYRNIRIYPSLSREEVQVSRVRSQELAQKRSDRGSGDDTAGRRSLATPIREQDSANSSLHTSARGAGTSGNGTGRGPRFVMWPEWSDADVNAEKWDTAHKGKEKEKGKSPVVQHFFDDPEGKRELPPVFKVSHWQRPQDFILDKMPVVVDTENMNQLNIQLNSDAVYESEITTLWEMCKVKAPPEAPEPGVPTDGQHVYTWRPWEHIYAINRLGKGPNIPAYNPYGKYVVKLYWMGCWRKLVVDDTIPFDDDKNMLLPHSTLDHELWPMLLSKALIKVASLDYNGGRDNCEFGDFSVIQCLTGWLPESIPIQQSYKDKIWGLLKTALPEWTLPEPPCQEEAAVAEATVSDGRDDNKDKISEKADTKSKDLTKDQKPKEKDKAKDEKKDKGKEKEKSSKKQKSAAEEDQDKEKGASTEEQTIPEHPEIVICAAYWGPPRYPASVSLLAEMADSSERLRQNNLSHMYPHPVLITHTRSCPLEPPPPPEVIPAWKLIRPRKKKLTPSDEPQPEQEEQKPIQSLWINSPFINYKVSSVPIPTDIHRPKSSLERGSTHTQSALAIDENEENPPATPAPASLAPPPAEPPAAAAAQPPKLPDDTKPDDVKSKGSSTKEKPKPAPPMKKEEKGELSDRQSTSSKDRKKMMSKESDTKSKASGQGVETAAGTPDPALDNEAGEQQGEPPGSQPDLTIPDIKYDTKIWMDFDNFCNCFRTLYIYHKPHTYPCSQKYTDPKMGAAVSKEKEKKSVPNTAASTVDEKSAHYLFVDNLVATEIVVNFSAIPEWIETGNMSSQDGGKAQQARDTAAENLTETSSVIDGGGEEETGTVTLKPGTLTAEPYSWKSLVTGQPLLRISTTASKAALLTLPEGRHVLRLHMNAPMGYHVHLCSTTQFLFGDEDKVMAELVKESCRFVDNATQVMTALGKCIAAFSDAEAFHAAWQEFVHAHCPYLDNKTVSKKHHFTLFNDALYSALKKALLEAQLCTQEMAFAWRAFNFDCTTPNILGSAVPSSRPATGVISDRGSAKGKVVLKKQVQSDMKLDWNNREPTLDEHVAAIKIQKSVKGFWVRKIKLGRTPGTEENVKVKEQLQKAWAVMEPSIEQIGLTLFRSLFKADPELMPIYPFYKDEWNKISYADYSGAFADQPAHTWFLVFREIFYVSEEMLCVPKLYVPINTCLLRVIDNDTGQEIPRVFQKVAPYVYKKNERGYTFVAEARTTEQPLNNGRWRMRLIGSLSPLPAPARNEVNCSFNNREIRDYYIPAEKNVMLRYHVPVNEDHLASIQLSTSKPDVYVKLQVLDNEAEVTSAVGKGHVVLPAFMFKKDIVTDQEDEPESKKSSRPASRASAKDAKTSRSNSPVKKNSMDSQDGRASQLSMGGSVVSETQVQSKPHKYIIQALVLRNSWPLDSESLAFVNMLKEMEKNELKVPRPDKTASATSSKGKDKPGKGKVAKEKDKSSRPPSQQFDNSKPSWTLRVISDAACADEIDVRKDTERADEIRAMKKAWEQAEPGRAAKALQSRLAYLNSHMVVVDSAGVSSDVTDVGEKRPASAVKVLKPLDISPFLRSSGLEPCIQDDAVLARQLEMRQAQIAEYRQYRQQVEQQRQQDRINRNKAKIQQLQDAERLQAILDAAREAINIPREEYRQKFLAAERQRQEQLAALEAAQRAELEKAAPSPKGRKSANKSPKKGKK